MLLARPGWTLRAATVGIKGQGRGSEAARIVRGLLASLASCISTVAKVLSVGMIEIGTRTVGEFVDSCGCAARPLIRMQLCAFSPSHLLPHSTPSHPIPTSSEF